MLSFQISTCLLLFVTIQNVCRCSDPAEVLGLPDLHADQLGSPAESLKLAGSLEVVDVEGRPSGSQGEPGAVGDEHSEEVISKSGPFGLPFELPIKLPFGPPEEKEFEVTECKDFEISRLPTTIRPQHYDINLNFLGDHMAFFGTVDIKLIMGKSEGKKGFDFIKSLLSGSEIILNAGKALEVEDVWLTIWGSTEKFKAREVCRHGEFIKITLEKKVPEEWHGQLHIARVESRPCAVRFLRNKADGG